MRTYSDDAGRRSSHVTGPRPRLDGGAGPIGLVAQRLADPVAVAELQRSAGNGAVAQLLRDEDGGDARSPVLDVIGQGGQPLDGATRLGMEQALDADLSTVRVHTDGAAAASARSVQAHAYTVGEDVVFGSGRYQPDTPDGQRMLAHELTHVVQQRSGPVAGTPTEGGISVSDPGDPFERAAESNADRIMSGHPGHESGPVAEAASPASMQRAADAPEEDESLLQGLWMQREAAPEEEEEPAPA